MVEIYKLPQGKIMVGVSNKTLSVGVLILNPDQELPKHDRPVKEQLVQVLGTSTIKMFSGETHLRDVVLKEGEMLEMSPNQLHIHSNQTKEKSITLWKFEGDITEKIENIRKNYKRIL